VEYVTTHRLCRSFRNYALDVTHLNVAESGCQPLIINKITHLEGANDLAPGATIKFASSGLTIVAGRNLDPYSLQVKWQLLKVISKTRIFDVWYLFPFMALNRLLRRDKDISDSHRSIIDIVLGTDDWVNDIYSLSRQLSFFGEEYEKNTIDVVKQYFIKRLKTVFPAVSPNAMILRAVQTNTPLFLLCFATSNPSSKAIGLALNGANHILTHT